MTGLLPLLLVLLVAIIGTASSASSVLEAHIETLARLHKAYSLEKASSASSSASSSAAAVDVGFLRFVMELHDDDARCDARCEAQLVKFLLKPVLKDEDVKSSSDNSVFVTEDGHVSITFDRFKALLERIYPGAISTDPYEPQELHLALASSGATTMKVMWVTMSELELPVVQYMPASTTATTTPDWSKAAVASAVTSTYRVEKKWWPIFTGTIYDADMQGLVPDAKYIYRVGGYSAANATLRFSDSFEFKAPPPTTNGDKNRPTTIAALADHGTFEFLGFAVVDKMVAMKEKLGFEMVMVAGDLSYAGLSSAFPPLNITSEDEFEHIWDLLFIQNQAIAANMAWMSGDGNHERFYNWSAFTHRYQMPQSQFPLPAPSTAAATSNGNFWFSYVYGNTRWISISSEHDLDAGSPQMNYLTAALTEAQSQRGVVPWVIVTIHKPLYCSDSGTPGGYADKLEDTFIAFDVDLVISGHMHVYERISPVYKGGMTCPPTPSLVGDAYYSQGKGPVYVVQGNSGAMQFDRWLKPQPAWSAYRMANGLPPQGPSYLPVGGVGGGRDDYAYTDTYGFGVIATSNATHLQYTSIPITGDFVDTFWIVKRV